MTPRSMPGTRTGWALRSRSGRTTRQGAELVSQPSLHQDRLTRRPLPVLSAVLSEGRATAGLCAAATRQLDRCVGGNDTPECDRAIKSVMEMLCVDSRKFSGKSMRRSGLSAAIIQSMLAMRRDRLLFGPARRRGARQSTTLHHPHTALGREKAFSLWSSA